MGKSTQNNLITVNFADRNYEITSLESQPKFSFLYNDNHKLSTFYNFTNKENTILNKENLEQHKLGFEYFYNSAKNNQISVNFTYFKNNFDGNVNSPVAYQMLEGLQNGNNITWNLIFNKKINSFLNFKPQLFW
ncbi:MAG: hypothetical protein HC798_04215 [Polaribacter sp.]|nr:hypothetical protein [Polaribacter sp.]